MERLSQRILHLSQNLFNFRLIFTDWKITDTGTGTYTENEGDESKYVWLTDFDPMLVEGGIGVNSGTPEKTNTGERFGHYLSVGTLNDNEDNL